MVQLFVNAALVLTLLAMAWQDLRYRGISWYHFLTLGVFLCLSKGRFTSGEVLINLVFLGMVFGLLTAWFSLKEGRFLNLFSAHIGLGDLLFLLCIALYFSFSSFFFFYLLSTLLILIGVGIYLFWSKPESFTVPLAGLQSLLLLTALMWSWGQGQELYEFNLLYPYW